MGAAAAMMKAVKFAKTIKAYFYHARAHTHTQKEANAC